MKILVTGTEGYIGSLLAPLVRDHGHEVVGLDTGFYTSGQLYTSDRPSVPTTAKDIRNLTPQDLEGFDAVVHLAELSNDPAGQLNPEATFEINHKGSVQLASYARLAGVKRFVYTSSCSVYGIANDEIVNESSSVNPQTAYAECKVLVERGVSELAGDEFSPTFLRNATAFGPSPRMRFDIVLNNLAGLAWTTREIKMTSDGSPWRPLVHVLDICQAVICTLEAPREAVHNQVFNVGDTSANYRVREIAETVAGVFDGCSMSFGSNGSDNRSYRVSFDKINNALPGFECAWSIADGARQLYEVFERVGLNREIFECSAFTRLKELEHLLSTNQIDSHFFWTNGGLPHANREMQIQRQTASTHLR
jgi:nucleoside-diphosphate-sugar epimerase